MKPDKAQVQAAALGVVVSWLRSESHLDGENENERHIIWAMEAQERIAIFIELEAMKLRLKSKTLQQFAAPERRKGTSPLNAREMRLREGNVF